MFMRVIPFPVLTLVGLIVGGLAVLIVEAVEAI
jgi:hypothetical protein